MSGFFFKMKQNTNFFILIVVFSSNNDIRPKNVCEFSSNKNQAASIVLKGQVKMITEIPEKKDSEIPSSPGALRAAPAQIMIHHHTLYSDFSMNCCLYKKGIA